MKKFINHKREFCTVSSSLFIVLKNHRNGKYYYYLSCFLRKAIGDRLIYKSNKKSQILCKPALSALSIIFNAIVAIIIPIIILFFPIYCYLEGCRNFIRNKMWAQNERYANWVNFALIIVLTILLINKW